MYEMSATTLSDGISRGSTFRGIHLCILQTILWDMLLCGKGQILLLQTVWMQLERQIDVGGVTNYAYVEHLR
jgi:hypothetical protein